MFHERDVPSLMFFEPIAWLGVNCYLERTVREESTQLFSNDEQYFLEKALIWWIRGWKSSLKTRRIRIWREVNKSDTRRHEVRLVPEEDVADSLEYLNCNQIVLIVTISHPISPRCSVGEMSHLSCLWNQSPGWEWTTVSITGLIGC